MIIYREYCRLFSPFTSRGDSEKPSFESGCIAQLRLTILALGLLVGLIGIITPTSQGLVVVKRDYITSKDQHGGWNILDVEFLKLFLYWTNLPLSCLLILNVFILQIEPSSDSNSSVLLPHRPSC